MNKKVHFSDGVVCLSMSLSTGFLKKTTERFPWSLADRSTSRQTVIYSILVVICIGQLPFYLSLTTKLRERDLIPGPKGMFERPRNHFTKLIFLFLPLFLFPSLYIKLQEWISRAFMFACLFFFLYFPVSISLWGLIQSHPFFFFFFTVSVLDLHSFTSEISSRMPEGTENRPVTSWSGETQEFCVPWLSAGAFESESATEHAHERGFLQWQPLWCGRIPGRTLHSDSLLFLHLFPLGQRVIRAGAKSKL